MGSLSGQADKGILSGYGKPVAISCLSGAAISTAILLVFALVMSVRDVPAVLINPLACAAIAVGSFFAGFLCAKMLRQRGMLFGALCGILMFGILLFTSLTLTGDAFGWIVLIKLVIVMTSAMIGGVIGVNTRRRRR